MFTSFIGAALVATGCKPLPPEKHRVIDGDTEFGVEITVILKGGGEAVLVCPKFTNKPRGGHGRECYLRSYNKKPRTIGVRQ